MVALDTTLSPLALLDALQAIERQHGRERPYRNAPRTLDLDLLLFGEQIITDSRLTVPHPRLLERAFVVYPLLEIAPHAAIGQVHRKEHPEVPEAETGGYADHRINSRRESLFCEERKRIAILHLSPSIYLG